MSFWISAVSWIVKSVAIDTVAGGFHRVLDLSSIFDPFIGYFLLYYIIWICSVMSVWHFIFGWGGLFHIVVIPSSLFHSGFKKTSRICGRIRFLYHNLKYFWLHMVSCTVSKLTCSKCTRLGWGMNFRCDFGKQQMFLQLLFFFVHI